MPTSLGELLPGTMSAAGMHNSEGVNVDLYIPRKCSATNRLIQAKDKASIQLNIGHVNAAGVYTGEFTPLALCGFVRAMGEADGNLDRLWTKCYDESKLAGVEI
ncbi:hypothetical protein AB1Y20_008396 [Prymnesium parvum]|uniref:40S ribosomal protein S21 n=1 Tax=Prymnesium parvum TaxID=97485 RepID=A0AB34IQY2_PRYPA|mmetsp:Transcript_27105/g.40912  ORF Transcript_27105/g.40912 Transcript_27105/m.40912 type:complete len:104 (+) Transcript_27105:352-663(+)